MEAAAESREAEILTEIRESEKRAVEIIEKAGRESESIMQEAARNSSKLLPEKEAEIRKSQEKKIMDFREKARLIREEKLAEGRLGVKQLKAKAEKNIPKSVEFIMKKFEEAV
ncbi:hypothetical protein HYX08_06065 [Candidatus Woesearchaeota archaeon]|nr:hypothetical protein [Candidatus Woesearchaeota archaeon]